MDNSDSVLHGHVVACALPFWGHTKSLCVILSKLVRLRPMYATLFTEVSVLDKVENELQMQFPSESQQSLKEQIRVVVLPSPQSPFRLDGFQTYFLDAYKSLYDGRAIHSGGASHIVYNAVPPPRLVILDFFFYKALKGIHAISGSSVPVYAWQTGAVAALVYLFGPESMGGNGDIAEKIGRITSIDTEVQNKEIEKIYNRTNGHLVEIRGIPPMYDYEHVPQISALPVEPIEVILMSQYGNRFLSECDGIISMSSRLFEAGPIEQWQEYLKPRPVFAVGPLSDLESVKLDTSRYQDVLTFLAEALEKFGPYSVVYISFGSVLWPAEPAKLWTIVDILIQEGIPFILSHASLVAIIPDSMMEKIKAFRFGFAATFVPQQLILQHEACGWFLTHCGHNSVMESMSAGVPLICWPFSVDQPVNAANVSIAHNIGYELLEVRNGHGLRPLHRLGNKRPEGTVDAVKREILDVLYKARGEDGKAKRMRAQSFKNKLSEDTTQGGRAYTDLDRLARIIV